MRPKTRELFLLSTGLIIGAVLLFALT